MVHLFNSRFKAPHEFINRHKPSFFYRSILCLGSCGLFTPV